MQFVLCCLLWGRDSYGGPSLWNIWRSLAAKPFIAHLCWNANRCSKLWTVNLRWEIDTKREEQRHQQGDPLTSYARVACNEGCCLGERGKHAGSLGGPLTTVGGASWIWGTIAKLEDDQEFSPANQTQKVGEGVRVSGYGSLRMLLSGVNRSWSLAIWCLIRMIIKWLLQRNLRQGKSSWYLLSNMPLWNPRGARTSPLLSQAGWPPAALSLAELLPDPLPERHRSQTACSCRNPLNPGKENPE